MCGPVSPRDPNCAAAPAWASPARSTASIIRSGATTPRPQPKDRRMRKSSRKPLQTKAISRFTSDPCRTTAGPPPKQHACNTRRAGNHKPARAPRIPGKQEGWVVSRRLGLSVLAVASSTLHALPVATREPPRTHTVATRWITLLSTVRQRCGSGEGPVRLASGLIQRAANTQSRPALPRAPAPAA